MDVKALWLDFCPPGLLLELYVFFLSPLPSLFGIPHAAPCPPPVLSFSVLNTMDTFLSLGDPEGPLFFLCEETRPFSITLALSHTLQSHR